MRRFVVVLLLLCLPLATVSFQLSALLGPLHLHEGAPTAVAPDVAADNHWHIGSAEASYAHPHQHGLSRHRHGGSDRTVILIDAPDEPGAGASGAGLASLPLAPPVAWHFAFEQRSAALWPLKRASTWRDHHDALPERPPRNDVCTA